MIYVVSVYNKPDYPDAKGNSILSDVQEFLKIQSVKEIKAVKKYYLEGISEEEVKEVAENLLCEDVWQEYKIDSKFFKDARYIREVAYKPGMMNPEAMSIIEAVKDMGFNNIKAADSGYEYYFYGDSLREEDVDKITTRLLMNVLIEDIREETPKSLIIKGETPEIMDVPLTKATDDQLMSLSENKLFLNLEEMKIIQDHFRKLKREPTDGELEVLAQTWSEHCVHKTFKAKLTIDGSAKEPLFSRLKKVTEEVGDERIVSKFIDNSGVVEFFDGYSINGKVETHNSPSALDPYGGAMTGSGGVFRDILGTGQGAKVTVSTDMFCFAPPDMPEEKIPHGCKHPRYLFKKVVHGVRDYGNRMGIPTNNGSVHFHPDFKAKPTIIVGSYGLIPTERAKKGKALPKDLIVTIGGKTGRDGIHGATFSSGAMTSKTEQINSTAVQIGNAIEEKRMHDAILEIRDMDCIRALTDCGAGGFSSAIGEMGEHTGAKVNLEKAPVKYSSLAPWEIWISESQERMVAAIPKERWDEAREVFKKFNVEATIIGEFTDTKRLEVNYNAKSLIDLDMDFLHNGLPQRHMVGSYTPDEQTTPVLPREEDFTVTLKKVLSHYNVCSKELIVRQYDHNVQGSAVQMPFCGESHSACNDASVVEPILGSGRGMAVAHGLNPVLNKIDPYFGSQWAILEAVSNIVAVGTDLKDVYLIDNFIWPVPDEKYLGYLDRSVDACVDTVRVLGTPFISGKDSLSSSYRGEHDLEIHIPPVLCISAFGRIADIKKTVSAPFKKKGNKVLIVGETGSEMGGSIYYDIYKGVGNDIPHANIEKVKRVYEKLFDLMQKGLIQSCHDISEGGLAGTLAEMCFTNGLGVAGSVENVPSNEELDVSEVLFSETPGRFVIEIEEKDLDKMKKEFGDVAVAEIGEVNDSNMFVLRFNGVDVVNSYVTDLKRAWETPLKKIF